MHLVTSVYQNLALVLDDSYWMETSKHIKLANPIFGKTNFSLVKLKSKNTR